MTLDFSLGSVYSNDGFSHSISPIRVLIFFVVLEMHDYAVAAVFRKEFWLKPCQVVLGPRLKSWVSINNTISNSFIIAPVWLNGVNLASDSKQLTMLIQILKKLFARDLSKLKSEIELYRDENKIWYTEKQISNSAGNLCLHLIGNLNTYIGAGLGNTNYIRHRELEFSLKDIPRSALIRMIKDTIAVVDNTLSTLTEEELRNEYPILVFDQKTSSEYMLIHLTTHLAYHLGQVNYHRRLLDAQMP